MRDIRITIQNLLNLANDKGATESEAKAALLKAKELMIKYNVENIKNASTDNLEVKEYLTDISFTKNTEPWINRLASVISKNFRCETFFIHKYNSKSRIIGFYGYEEDLKICSIVFNYALFCIWNKFPSIRNKMKEEFGLNIKQARPFTDGYAVGFINGIKEAFDQQYEDNKSEWGLIALTPPAVVEYGNNIPIVTIKDTPHTIDSTYYNEGLIDGKNWKPQPIIENK